MSSCQETYDSTLKVVCLFMSAFFSSMWAASQGWEDSYNNYLCLIVSSHPWLLYKHPRYLCKDFYKVCNSTSLRRPWVDTTTLHRWIQTRNTTSPPCFTPVAHYWRHSGIRDKSGPHTPRPHPGTSLTSKISNFHEAPNIKQVTIPLSSVPVFNTLQHKSPRKP